MISEYIENTNLMLTTAIIVGLLFPAFSRGMVGYVVFYLIVIMTLTTAQIKLGELEDLRGDIKQVFTSFLISYGFLSGTIFFLTLLLISNPDLKAGFIMMVAMPSAVAIIPFTNLSKGNERLSLISSSFIYLLSPVMASLIIYLFLGFKEINALRFIEVLVELILLPLFLSRLIPKVKFYGEIKKAQDIVVNLCFFALIYSIVGVNRHIFFGEPQIVFIVSTICFLRTFVTGTLVYLGARWIKVEKRTAITYTFFGSFKNMGVTATMALALINEVATIPAAIGIPFEILAFVYLGRLIKSDEGFDSNKPSRSGDDGLYLTSQERD